MSQSTVRSILQSDATVFTFKEIFMSAGLRTSSDQLRKRLSYYVQKGQLYHIRRGLYAKNASYDRRELATKIFTPSYVSFETVLSEAGVIFQYYSQIFIASYQSKEIECDGYTYVFKKIKNDILLNNRGVENKGTYFAATKERAFLDTLYLDKDYYFDNLAPLDFEKIQALLPIYNNKRMERTVRRYFKHFRKEQG